MEQNYDSFVKRVLGEYSEALKVLQSEGFLESYTFSYKLKERQSNKIQKGRMNFSPMDKVCIGMKGLVDMFQKLKEVHQKQSTKRRKLQQTLNQPSHAWWLSVNKHTIYDSSTVELQHVKKTDTKQLEPIVIKSGPKDKAAKSRRTNDTKYQTKIKVLTPVSPHLKLEENYTNDSNLKEPLTPKMRNISAPRAQAELHSSKQRVMTIIPPEINTQQSPGCSVNVSHVPKGNYYMSPKTGKFHKLYLCKLCKKLFLRKANRDCHEAIHTGDLHFYCSVCPKAYATQAKLNGHMHTHREPRYSCGICGRKFITNFNCKQHEKTHVKNEVYYCSCGKRFHMQLYLTRHQKSAHNLHIQKHKCKVCGLTFDQEQLLIDHVDSHETLGTFRKKHQGGNSYRCSICSRRFVRKCHFEEHLRTHSSDRPHVCLTCGKAFREQKHWRAHMNTVHPSDMNLQALLASFTPEDVLGAEILCSMTPRRPNIDGRENVPPVHDGSTGVTDECANTPVANETNKYEFQFE